MPVTKSAKKALRVSRRKSAVNAKIRNSYKEALKKARKHPTEDNLKKTFSILDKAAKANVIHPNKANRLKSRLAKLFSKSAPEKEKVRTRKTKRSPKKKKITKSSK
jgi:small subunit ribosomal protein S20